MLNASSTWIQVFSNPRKQDSGVQGGADQRSPNPARPTEEKDCADSQAEEHPLTEEILRAAKKFIERIEARARAPEQRPLQNRHERMRPPER